MVAERRCLFSSRGPTLGFDAVYDFDAKRRIITNREATQHLYSMYPMPVQSWIAERGGLTPRMILLRGKALRRCTGPAISGEAQRFGHLRPLD
jgi:hypothetical protein